MPRDNCRLWIAECVRAFLDGSDEQDVKRVERAAADFMTRASDRLGHGQLSCLDGGIVRQFLSRMTGLSRAQTFMVRRWRSTLQRMK